MRNFRISVSSTQPTLTCSELTIETLEQRCEICSKFAITTPKRRQWRPFGVFIVNFEHISHLYSSVSIVNFEHVIAGWEVLYILELYIIQKYLKLGRYNTYSGIKQCIV